MTKIKNLLRLCFGIEFLVGIFLLFFYRPADCIVDCLNGLNEFFVYLLPIVGVTLFAYTIIKVYESRAKKQRLKSDHKYVHFFISFLVLLIIIYGLYYWFNR